MSPCINNLDVVAKYYFIDEYGEVLSIRTNKVIKPWGSGGHTGNKYLKFSPSIHSKKLRVYIHQLQARVKYGDFDTARYDIDHINGNTRDNRRENIRILPKEVNRSLGNNKRWNI